MIRHEIILGRAERDLIEPLLYSKVASNLANPIVEIFKDASALLAVATLFEYYTGIDLPIPTGADAQQIWEAIVKGVTTAKENRQEFGAATDPESQSFAMTKLLIAELIQGLLNTSTIGGQEYNNPANTA